jgi:acylphosphatase
MSHKQELRCDRSGEQAGVAQCEAVVRGHVQGVHYRYHTRQHAQQLGLRGYVENMPDGTVYVLAQGERDALLALLAWLRTGPRAAEVSDVDVHWGTGTARPPGFEVHH